MHLDFVPIQKISLPLLLLREIRCEWAQSKGWKEFSSPETYLKKKNHVAFQHISKKVVHLFTLPGLWIQGYTGAQWDT